MVKVPMTRTEACQILNIEDAAGDQATEPVDYKEVMERYDTLFEKNSEANGGSFYIRSKIFFAKEHLMMDWPAELNKSQFDEENIGDLNQEEGDANKEQAAKKDDQASTDENQESADAKKDNDKDPKHPNKQ